MMKKLFIKLFIAIAMLCQTLTSAASNIPNNEIWYTSSDGKVINPYNKNVFGANIISNVYTNGKGKIKFDRNVTSIGDEAFKDCETLTSIEIPNSVISFGKGAFKECIRLNSFYGKCASNDHRCLIVNGILASFAPAGLTEYTIPNHVTAILASAFWRCKDLRSVTLSNSITFIDWFAFCECISLTSINIPNTVTSIGPYAFAGCTALNSIKLSNSLAEIGMWAFQRCTRLTSINIPESVTWIGHRAFVDCSSLTSVFCESLTPPSIDSKIFEGCSSNLKIYVPRMSISKYETTKNWRDYASRIVGPFVERDNYTHSNEIRYTSSDGNVITPYLTDGFGANIISNKYINGQGVIKFDRPVTTIARSAFYSCEYLTSIEIPCDVTTIGAFAFWLCPNLTSVKIPDSVTTIEQCAFASCTSLSTIEIPNSVTSIGDSAFEYCTNLTTVLCLPTTPPRIGSKVFYTNLKDNMVYIPTIYVPNTSVNKYKTATNWSFYNKVIEGYALFESNNIPNNEIWYQSYDGKVVTPNKKDVFGANIVSNKYIFGKGVIKFDRPITAIGNNAFYNCSNFTSIKIPNSVTSIGAFAFCGCSCLTSITIPNSVARIENHAFASCNSLSWIEIPNSVTSIGIGAFNNCSRLNSFYGKFASNDKRCLIVDGVLTSFAPAGLTTYSIPNSVTSIAEEAFFNCSNLTSIKIPNSVTSIGGAAFYWCHKLSFFYGKYASEDNRCLIVDGVLTSFAPDGLTEYTIPNSVTTIRKNTFNGCSKLTSIRIPSSVTSIEFCVFYDCKNLTKVYCNPITSPTLGGNVFNNCSSNLKIYVPTSSVDEYKAATNWSTYASKIIDNDYITNEIWYTSSDGRAVIPHNKNVFDANIISNEYSNGQGIIKFDRDVTSIGDLAFRGCSNLTSIKIPNSVTSIGYRGFEECKELTSIKIPDSVTSIGRLAFHNCYSLTSFYGKYASEDNRCLIINGVLTSFAPAGLTEYTIPKSVTSIGDWAFANCSNLISVTLPSTVTSIGNYTFDGCKNLTAFYGKYASNDNRCWIVDGVLNSFAPAGLTEYTIPSSVTSIEAFIFNGCSNLVSVTIPSTVTSIGYNAFVGCTNLTSFYGKYASKDNRCLIVDGVLTYCAPAGLTEYTIPKSVTSIGNWAFSDCSSLTSIKMPNSVTSIGDYAFYECESLQSIKIPNSVTSIGNSAFYDCTSLTSIKIPNSVTSIGKWAFRGCSSLTSIEIPNSVTSIENSAFFNCSNLTSIKIPNTVTSIGDWAFWNCSNLNSIKIPNTVTSIGDYAFQFCSSLTSIKIPKSVTSIGEGAFSDCTSLTSIEIPKSIKTIGDSAFHGCSSLISVFCKSPTPPSIGSGVFLADQSDSTIFLPKIYVPKNSISKYKAALDWSEYVSYIEGYDF